MLRAVFSVFLPLLAHRALETYLETCPPITSSRAFIGERGPRSVVQHGLHRLGRALVAKNKTPVR